MYKVKFDNSFKHFATRWPAKRCAMQEIFMVPPHLFQSPVKLLLSEGLVLRKLTVLMSSCRTLCPPGSDYSAAIAHLQVIEWRSSTCSAVCNLTLDSLFHSSQRAVLWLHLHSFSIKHCFLLKKPFPAENMSSPVQLSFSGSQKIKFVMHFSYRE